MTLFSQLDGGILTIRSVDDQSPLEGLQQMRAALDLARAHHRSSGERCHLLVDLRESGATREPGELRDVAAYLAGKQDILTGRIAVVVERGLRFGLARMFAVYGENLGLITMVFTADSAARNWLTRGRPIAESGEA